MAVYNVDLRRSNGTNFDDQVKLPSAWALIDDKPTTFTPTSHTHPYLADNHAASGVTSQKITNWDAAHGWGNHASAGYLSSLPSHAHGLITNGGYLNAANKVLVSNVESQIVGEDKGTAFNKSFGTTVGTVCQGNDSRVVNAVPNSRKVNDKQLNADIALRGGDIITSGTTATAISTVAKVATISGYTLTAGDILAITFTNGNSANAPTLNINSAGAKNIRMNGANVTTTTFSLAAGTVVMLYYDGTYFQAMGSQRTSDSNTTYSEISTAEIDAGTASDLRTLTGRRAKYVIDKAIAGVSAGVSVTKLANYVFDDNFDGKSYDAFSTPPVPAGIKMVILKAFGGGGYNYMDSVIAMTSTAVALNCAIGPYISVDNSMNEIYIEGYDYDAAYSYMEVYVVA